MTASIVLDLTPDVRYVLRIADTCLIHAQRLAEWCGHAPVLEEDIALSNLGLDLLGQARALLTHAAELEGGGHDEDALAFLRDEKDYFNLTLVELPLRRGGADFADTQLRCLLIAAWLTPLWQGLQSSRDRDQRDVDRTPRTPHDEVAELVEDRLERERVTRALAALTPAQRESIELAYFSGYTYREVAAVLEVPEGTVKTRIRDGLIRIRDELEVT